MLSLSKKPIYLMMFLWSLLLTLGAHAQSEQNTFNVRIQGPPKGMPLLQRRVDYKITSSLAFCRGFYFAKRETAWSCSKQGRVKVNCLSRFRCVHVRKNMSRASEKRKLGIALAKAQKKYGAVNVRRYKFYVDKKPYTRVSRQSLARARRKKKKRKAEKVVEPLEGPMIFKDEGIELFNEDVISLNGTDGVLSDEAQEIEDELEELVDASGGAVKKDEVWRFAEKDKVALLKEKRRKSPFRMRKMSVHFAFASSSDNNSFSAPGLSYTPSWRFRDNIHLGAEFGVHMFSIDENEVFIEENFLVFTYNVNGTYYFNDRIYGQLGLGIQSWGLRRTNNPNYLRFHYGLGYRFEEKKWKYIDRVYITAANMSKDDISVTDIWLGLGLSF